MNPFVPSIGSKGLFRVAPPFNISLVQDLEYTCVSMRSIQDISNDGVDVFAAYYDTQGLTLENMQADLAAGVFLVTLQPSTGLPVIVPSSYFIGIPDITGVPYMGTMIALDLSLLPSDLDLSYLKQRLADVVKDTIGVLTTPRTVVTTDPLRLRSDQHTVIDATRSQNRVEAPSDYAQYLAQKTRADSLQLQVGILQTYIKKNRPV
jgi:hypothetical protein